MKRGWIQVLVALVLALALAGAGGWWITGRAKGISSAPRLTDPSQTGLPRFRARRELLLEGLKVHGVLAADWDGDGLDDLLATTRHPGTLHVFSHAGGGLAGTRPPATFEIGGYPLGPVAFRSESGGHLLAVASQARRELVLLEIGSGPAGSELAKWPLGATPRVLAAGQVPDAAGERACVLTDDGRVLIAGAQGRRSIGSLGQGDAVCALLPPDGSGLLVGFQDSRRVAFFPFDDGGSLGSMAWSRSLDGIPRDMVLAELDDDPGHELVICGGDSSLWILGLGEADSDAGAASPWTLAPDLPHPSLRTFEVGAVPIDVDVFPGIRDRGQALAVLALESQSVTLLEGLSGPGPPDVRQLAAGQTPWALTIGDLDHDGALDIACANRDAYRISLCTGEERGGFLTADTIGTSRAPRSIAATDFDGDGDQDFVVLSSVERVLHVFENEHGRLAARRQLAVVEGARSVIAHDFDRDGFGDVLYLAQRTHGSELRLARGRPAGLVESISLTVDGVLEDLAVAEVSDGGALRMLVTDRTLAGLRVLEFETAPVGITLLNAPIPLPSPADAVDVACATTPARMAAAYSEPHRGAALRVFEWRSGATGSDEWSQVSQIPLPAPALDVRFADVDGDGLQDLVALISGPSDVSPGEVRTWLASEDDAWQELPPQRTGLAPFNLAVGDLNLDGRSEFAVAAKHSHQINAWLTRPGAPANLLRLPDLGTGQGPLDLLITDLDGDGWPDMVVCNHYGSSLSALRHQGLMPEPSTTPAQ